MSSTPAEWKKINDELAQSFLADMETPLFDVVEGSPAEQGIAKIGEATGHRLYTEDELRDEIRAAELRFADEVHTKHREALAAERTQAAAQDAERPRDIPPGAWLWHCDACEFIARAWTNGEVQSLVHWHSKECEGVIPAAEVPATPEEPPQPAEHYCCPDCTALSAAKGLTFYCAGTDSGEESTMSAVEGADTTAAIRARLDDLVADCLPEGV